MLKKKTFSKPKTELFIERTKQNLRNQTILFLPQKKKKKNRNNKREKRTKKETYE